MGPYTTYYSWLEWYSLARIVICILEIYPSQIDYSFLLFSTRKIKKQWEVFDEIR